jgi:hypothetical protein
MIMSAKEKLLLILVFVVVIAGLAMTHFGNCFARFIETCFAVVFPPARL